jgi:hypothetical protein
MREKAVKYITLDTDTERMNKISYILNHSDKMPLAHPPQ